MAAPSTTIPIVGPSSAAPAAHRPLVRCRYCGTLLDPFYYFCTCCATPYRNEEDLLPKVRPLTLTEGQLIRQKAPSVAPLFWTYCGVVLGVSILSALVFGDEHPAIGLFFGSAVFLITTCIVGAWYWSSLLVQFKQIGFNHPVAYLGVLAVGPLVVLDFAYVWGLRHAMGMEGRDLFQKLREAGFNEAAMVLTICILPAVTEEIAFRGLVQHWLQLALRPGRAILLAAALFAALHFSPLAFPYLLLVGLLLGWLKWKTGSLYPSMLVHFLHNLLVIELARWLV